MNIYAVCDKTKNEQGEIYPME